jgi:hypothetical protein
MKSGKPTFEKTPAKQMKVPVVKDKEIITNSAKLVEPSLEEEISEEQKLGVTEEQKVVVDDEEEEQSSEVIDLDEDEEESESEEESIEYADED